MRRRVRRLPLLLALLAGLLLVLGLRLALVLSSLEPEALRARLREEARARTGHDLTVADVHLSPLPPAVTLTGVTLGPAPGFGPEPLARAERLRATLRLLPLLRRELELGEVRVDGLQVELVRGTTGRGSWETLREHLGGQRGTEQEGLPALPGLKVRDARLRYRDLATDRQLELDGLSLSVGRGIAGAPQPVALEGALHSASPAVEGTLTATARLHTPPGALVQVQDLALDASLAADERSLALQASGPLELDTTRAHLTAPNLALHLDAAGEGLAPAHVEADLSALTRVDLRQGRVWLEDLRLTTVGLRASGELAVQGLPEAPELSGRLALAGPDLGASLARLGHPLSLSDPDALSQFSATLPFRWADGALALDDLDLRLGDARVTGDLAARGLRPPDLRFSLDASDLDLDGLRPQALGEPEAWANADLDQARISGRLRGHHLHVGGVTLSELDLPLRLEGGRLQLDHADVATLGGGLGLDLEADLSGDRPHRAAGELVTLDLAQLMEALGSERGLTGTAAAHGTLWAHGQQADTIKSSLAGGLCLSLTDGVIPLQRSDEEEPPRGGRARRPERAAALPQRLSALIERVIQRARERVGGQVPTQLNYHRLSACFDLQDGVASTADLQLDAAELQLEGAGQIDLAAGTLDLSCLLTLGELVPLGMRIQGPLDDPQVDVDKPDRMELVRDIMQRRREERRESFQEERQALRDELRAAGSDGLDALMDQRERALERRDEVREQVRDAVHDARDSLRDRRQEARGKLKERLGNGEEAADGEEAEGGEEPGEGPR